MIDYACLSDHSRPDTQDWAYRSYYCRCEAGYAGNAYITGGCSRDEGYDPFQRKTNCSRWCGNISVPYPFGLEDGCYARMSFHLNCTNSTMPALQFIVYKGFYNTLINHIDVNNGLVNVKNSYNEDNSVLYVAGDPELYVAYGETVSQQWAVANLTCQEAQQNRSGYACTSMNSTCLGFNSARGYVGYRCKCISGFDGNPYSIMDGCQDVDE